MTKQLLALPALAAALLLSGCANTLSGAKEDTSAAAQKTQQAATDAGQTVKESAQKAGKAVAEVPEDAEANALRFPIKTAIDTDVVLRDPRNSIIVSGSPSKITLTGHVAVASMKQRATDDAQAILKNHPGYTVVNALTVTGATQ